MPKLQVVNRDLKDLKVLLQLNDAQKAELFEAKSEADPALSRLDIYSSTSVAQSSQLCRTHQIELGVVCQSEAFGVFHLGLMDLLNACPTLKVVVLLKDLTFEAGSLLKANPTVINFQSLDKINSYETFREVVFSLVRASEADSFRNDDLESSYNLQRGLLVGHDDWAGKKDVARRTTCQLSDRFDLSRTQLQKIIVAENIYFPWLQPSEFSRLTVDLDPNINILLSETGSWLNNIRAPRSAGGFLITCANYLAECASTGKTAEEVTRVFAERPLYLKHPAVRVILPEIIAHALTIAQSDGLEKAG